MVLKDLIEKLRINPDHNDIREARYFMINISENIADIESEISFIKEYIKQKDADITQELKTKDCKITVKDINAEIRKRLNDDIMNELYKNKELSKLKATYNSVDKFLKSCENSAFYINQSKDDFK